MTFSEEFIKIMDYVGSKLGFVIDWTSQNIVPYMSELGQRIVNYEIATSSAYIVMFLIAHFIGKRTRKKAKKDWNWDDYAILTGFICVMDFFLFICAIFSSEVIAL